MGESTILCETLTPAALQVVTTDELLNYQQYLV